MACFVVRTVNLFWSRSLDFQKLTPREKDRFIDQDHRTSLVFFVHIAVESLFIFKNIGQDTQMRSSGKRVCQFLLRSGILTFFVALPWFKILGQDIQIDDLRWFLWAKGLLLFQFCNFKSLKFPR